MKQNIIKTIACLIFTSLAWSCEKEGLEPYQIEKDSVYITSQAYESPTSWGEREISVSFMYTNEDYVWVTIPIRIMGDIANYDRKVAVRVTPMEHVDPDGNRTFAEEGVHYDSAYGIIPQDDINGLIYVRTLRTEGEELSRQVLIRVTLIENENFDTKFSWYWVEQGGYKRQTLYRDIRISSTLTAPSWWQPEHPNYIAVERQLGLYHAVKFRLLCEITDHSPAFFEYGGPMEDGVKFRDDHIFGYATRLREHLYNTIVEGGKIHYSCLDVPGLRDMLPGLNWDDHVTYDD